MQIIRGTTPTIKINVKSDIDLTTVTEVWVYISQQKKVKIDKKLYDVTIDPENMKIFVTMSQEDTLNLKAGQDTIFQIRMLLSNNTALATIASEVEVAEVYKDGIISEEETINEP